MKTNGIRFFVSPAPGGGYLVEKIKDSKVIESFRGSTLTPDEVAQHMQDKGISNISILKCRIADYFTRTGIKDNTNTKIANQIFFACKKKKSDIPIQIKNVGIQIHATYIFTFVSILVHFMFFPINWDKSSCIPLSIK